MGSIRKIILLCVILLLTLSCYREELVKESPGEVFELSISPETQDLIHSSRDTFYSIYEPGIELVVNDLALDLKDMRIRGKNALDFPRKSYSVFLREAVRIRGRADRSDKMMSRFKLLAMAMDYTYIENRIGFGLLEQVGIMPLFYKFVEFRMNGNTEGVYMLVEDPEQYFKEQGSEFILRRYYHHWIADSEYEPYLINIPEDEYLSTFNEIYPLLVSHEGEALYQELNDRINMRHYFRKLGIDYLLKNGDYSDEIFLYALVQGEKIQFDIIPWDYDDLFSDHPHEVGVTWGTGTLFGNRTYPTYQDVLDVLGGKLIFSIEDDLDYVIATDSVLYTKYEEELSRLVGELEAMGFESLFGQIRSELWPYYQNNEIVDRSKLDRDHTTKDLWEVNMKEKQLFLEERLAAMKDQLNSLK